MGVRATMLELAIHGELETPKHGYELRQQLSLAFGPVRRLSFGSLYPALHRLSEAELIATVNQPPNNSLSSTPRRQVIYQITQSGREHLAAHLKDASVDDDSLPLTMRLMSKASPATRLELLKQRRAQVLARREANQEIQTSSDDWVRAKAEFDVAQADQELTWLDRLIVTLSPDDPPADRPRKRRTKRPKSKDLE